MAAPLRVLIVEDNESDAVLVLEALRDGGFEPDWRRVETEEDFLSQLDSGWNVILADYHLPQFNAFRILELLKERGLDIPCLVVTGLLGDLVAVACMHKGAADYLLKDRLARLGEAVKQAMERTQARARQRACEESLRRAHAELELRVQERTAELEKARQILSERIVELQDALAQIKQLQDFLPICMYCKKIRDDQNYWHQVETYISEHSGTSFSHGICPECLQRVTQNELGD